MKKYILLIITFVFSYLCYSQEKIDEIYFVPNKNYNLNYDEEKLPGASVYKNQNADSEIMQHVLSGYFLRSAFNTVIKYPITEKNQKITIPNLPSFSGNRAYTWGLIYVQIGENDLGLGSARVSFNEKEIDFETIVKFEEFIMNHVGKYFYSNARYRPMLFVIEETERPITFEIPFSINYNPDSYFSIQRKYCSNINKQYESEIIWNLMQLNKKQLRLLRNSIYASKGYIFKSEELNDFFKQSENYKPDVNVKESTINFSEEELKLLDLIKELENK